MSNSRKSNCNRINDNTIINYLTNDNEEVNKNKIKNDQPKIYDVISSNEVYYPTSNKVWFNQMGGNLYKTVYLMKDKKYIVEKIPWNRYNNNII
jgi:hypothetical protein